MTTSSSAPQPPAPGRPDVTPSRDPTRPFATTPFTRLARTHALGIAGDALFAIALAGSVFFSLDFDSARWSVALYLVLTIAPFAVAAPFIGPVLDRLSGGRKWMVVGGMAARALLCFFVIRHLDSVLFYPEAFLMLVLGKTYTISKSAIVPTTVRSDEELVEANSKLAVISALAVVATAPIAGLLLKLGGPGWALGLAMIVFAAAAVFGLQLPQVAVASQPADEAEKQELRSAGIFLAASAMGLVRAIVGFVSFMLAFDFKNHGSPLWSLGLVAATAQLGFFLGAIVVPRVRRYATEERILIGTLVVMVVGGLVTAVVGGLVGAATLSLIVGAASSMAKQAFDSIVQRDAPDANRGRSFARFETRFQLLWVIGALIPIVIPIPAEAGFVLLAAVALFAVISYIVGMSRIRKGGFTPPPSAPAPPAPPESGSSLEARRWTRAAQDAVTQWEPPPGFVSQPLDQEPTEIDSPSAPSGTAAVFDGSGFFAEHPDEPTGSEVAAGASPEPGPAPPHPTEQPPAPGLLIEQPELPLEPPVDVDGTVVDQRSDTEVFPEPPWRDASVKPKASD